MGFELRAGTPRLIFHFLSPSIQWILRRAAGTDLEARDLKLFSNPAVRPACHGTLEGILHPLLAPAFEVCSAPVHPGIHVFNKTHL
jgi:hypothetical protein